jgi:hypothetical protein
MLVDKRMARIDDMQADALTPRPLAAKAARMIRTASLIAVAAALVAGCNQDNTIVADGPDTSDPAAEALQANGPVALPPSVSASKTYRCADNSIVHIDWLSDGKSANVRTDAGGTVQVTAPEAGQPMTGGTGYSVAGTADAASAKIATGGPAQSCKA